MTEQGPPPPGQDVGSVGEEAAKLFAALSGFAREQGSQYAGAASGAATAASAALHGADEHLATGSPECTWCPLCQVIHAVRSTSPEVRQHLAVAAGSLAQAVAGMLSTAVPQDAARRTDPVERIDLDGDAAPDPPADGVDRGPRHG